MSKKKNQLDIEDHINPETGEIIDSNLLNEVIIKTTTRPNGTLRIQQDFSYCPTMSEQHTAHLTDINYLIKKYQPDELSAYISARSQHRREIIGHDFSREPTIQDAKNTILASKQIFEELPEKIKSNFSNHVDFIKFIDNPANAEKLVNMGILTKKQLATAIIPEPDPLATPPATTT